MQFLFLMCLAQGEGPIRALVDDDVVVVAIIPPSVFMGRPVSRVGAVRESAPGVVEYRVDFTDDRGSVWSAQVATELPHLVETYWSRVRRELRQNQQ